MTSQTAAMQLIGVNQQNQLFVNPKALQFLQNLKHKSVSIVSVVGLYRTGKSYLLNRLLDQQVGFDIGGTVNACTKGIYIWGEPKEFRLSSGQTTNVIFLDTEGINAIDQDETHNLKIFSLAILLSSYFIYNSVGVIDEKSIDELSLVLELSKRIQQSQQPSGQNLRDYFPKFLWILRDFSLALEDEQQRPLSPRSYLEKALELRVEPAVSNSRLSISKGIQAKNQIRKSIRESFESRDCFTLVRPVIDESQLRNLSSVAWSSIRPEFRNQIAQLKQLIFSNLSPKLVGSHPVSPQGFCQLVNIYVKSINDGSIPTIQSTWSTIVELETRRAFEHARDELEKLLQTVFQQLPQPVAKLEQLGQDLQAKIFSEYQSSSIDSDIQRQFFQKLKELFDAKWNQIKQRNQQVLTDQVKKEIDSLWVKHIQPRLQNNDKDYSSVIEYEQDWRAKIIQPILQRYLEVSDLCYRGLVEYEPYRTGLMTVSSRLEKELSVLKTKQSDLLSQNAQLQAANATLQTQSKNMMEGLKVRYEQEIHKMQIDTKNLINNSETEKKQLEEKIGLVLNQNTELKRQIQLSTQISAENNKLKNDYQQNEKALKEERDRFKQELENVNKQRDLFKQKAETLQVEQDHLRAERDALKQERESLLKERESMKQQFLDEEYPGCEDEDDESDDNGDLGPDVLKSFKNLTIPAMKRDLVKRNIKIPPTCSKWKKAEWLTFYAQKTNQP